MTKRFLPALLGATALSATAAMAGDFAEDNYTTDLSEVCPSPLILQKDWLMQAEHGPFIQLIGSGGTMEQGAYRGPLGSTGIELVVLEGGGGIGLADGETSYSALFRGNNRANLVPHLAYHELDNAFIFSEQFPAIGVFAPLDVAPTALIWDAATYPDGFNSIEDLIAFAESGQGMIYVSTISRTFGRYLVEQGVPAEAFVEGYRGDAENFVVNNGTWLNQGFATSEIYSFETGNNWARPMDYVFINDLGYPNYTGMVSVSRDRLDELAPCLEAVVPIMQQAAIDYATDPVEVNEIVIAFNAGDYNVGWWTSDAGQVASAAQVMAETGIIGNGANDTIGDFDMTRVQVIYDAVFPNLDERANPDVTPEDVVTNRFIDPSIGFE